MAHDSLDHEEQRCKKDQPRNEGGKNTFAAVSEKKAAQPPAGDAYRNEGREPWAHLRKHGAEAVETAGGPDHE